MGVSLIIEFIDIIQIAHRLGEMQSTVDGEVYVYCCCLLLLYIVVVYCCCLLLLFIVVAYCCCLLLLFVVF